ncbi:MAG: AAA family ATPase [Terriglobia bacterium]
MFLDYYRLREQPFGVTPDPRFLYLARTHREALASLFYGIEAGRGFMALIARPGMGKTTLLFQLLERLRKSACFAFLFQTQCNSLEFLRYLLLDMGLDAGGKDLVSMHQQLNEALVRMSRNGRRFVLVIDEAQNLDDSVLETVRLLSDFETSSSKLIQIVLAGQPQLATKLARPSLVQLRQRIAILSRLEPLSPAETGYYIAHRLQVGGYEGGPLFDREALALIGARSRGVPRNINNICFNALSLGFALRRKRIDARLVREVVADLELEPLVRESRDPVHSALTPDPAAPLVPGVARRSPGGAWRAFRVASLAVFMVLASLFIFTSIRSVLKIHPGRLFPPTAAAANGQSTPERPLETSKPSSLPTPVPGQGLGRDAEGGTRGPEARMVIVTGRPRQTLRQIWLRRPGRFNDRVIEQISAFNPELTGPGHILESLPSQYRDLNPAALAAPGTAGASPTETIKAELTRLRKERADLLTRYTARYPDVLKIDQQIKESEALLAASAKAAEHAKHGTDEAGQQRPLPLEVRGSPGTKVGPAVNVLDITSSRNHP